MEEALGELFGALENPDVDSLAVAEVVATDDGMMEAIKQIREMAPRKLVVKPQPIMLQVPDFCADTNIVDTVPRREFAGERVFRETDTMTQPQPTTITVSSFIANVSFMEADLVKILPVCEQCVVVSCNFERKVWPGFAIAVPPKKSNRGRKPKANSHKRKKQGSGAEFNSQISFYVRTGPGANVYKFKVFRNGKLQLPGITRLEAADEIIACVNIVVDKLNAALHPDELDQSKLAKLIFMTPVMKNYKFRAKFDPTTHLVALDVLRDIIIDRRDRANILDIKYGKQDIKLSVRFLTPTPSKPHKCVRVNVFMSGKINILGGSNAQRSSQICEFLDEIISSCYDQIIVPIGCMDIPADMPEDVPDIQVDLNEMSSESADAFALACAALMLG